MKLSTVFHMLLGVAFAFAAAPAVQAQAYPSKPITIVIGYPPGGGADAIARLVGSQLSQVTGQSVIVDNRGGFSGNIGAASVAKGAADGYTVLVAPTTTYRINGILYGDKVGYDLEKDFTPVSLLGVQPMVLMVNPHLPVNNVAELLEYAKSHKLDYGSTGVGSLEHIAAELFFKNVPGGAVHVPYRGNGPAIVDLMGGQIDVLFATAPTVVSNKDSGRIKGLMVTTAERNPALPNLPTPAEAGLKGFDVVSTYSMLVPAATPKDVVEALNAAVVKALKTPKTVETFGFMGVQPQPTTLGEAKERLTKEYAKWAVVIKENNIKAE
ncbi:Bug family tripartite tricarboxylate transporter substrate binding protein [Paracandidimonas soli]|uniref:Tripartite-type tricarboxylate transporter receptor subunit TctC n=1 Tax=Paracandidimonas soli TaxID=1917182 RepID=A0A4V2VSJ6_9BURK|nr:tripartite tricarboxylate transporter substrate binding protein [Paracandidimonas soli]TCV02630.1 tripartite-type tricarboxylate transporter receptor subunit TctC [Paracandidimonas soli]